jgi:MFS family permease
MNVVTTVALVFSRSVGDIVLLRLFGGLALGMYSTTVEVLITDLAPIESRVKHMGWYGAATTTGFLIGPILGGFVIQEMGFVRLFFFSAVVSALSFIPVTIWNLPSCLRREHVVLGFSGVVRTIRGLLPWYMMIACYGIVYSVVTTIFPGYANSVGVSVAFIGYLFAAFGISKVFAYATLESYLMLGERRVLLIAALLMAIGVVGLGTSASFIGFLAAIMLIGGCSGVIFPITIGLISRHFPDRRLGAGVGSYETAISIGQAVGPFLAGIVASLTNVGFSFLLMALFGVLMAIFIATGRSHSVGST